MPVRRTFLLIDNIYLYISMIESWFSILFHYLFCTFSGTMIRDEKTLKTEQASKNPVFMPPTELNAPAGTNLKKF